MEPDRTQATGFAGLAFMVSDVEAMLAGSLRQPANAAPVLDPKRSRPNAPATQQGNRASTTAASTESGRRWPWVLGAIIVLGWLWLAVRAESTQAVRVSPARPPAPTAVPVTPVPKPRGPTLSGHHSMTVNLTGTMQNIGDEAPVELKCQGITGMRVTKTGSDLHGVLGPGTLTCRALGSTFPLDWNHGFEGSEIDSKVSFNDGSCEYSGNATGGIVICSESDTSFSVSLTGTWRVEPTSADAGTGSD